MSRPTLSNLPSPPPGKTGWPWTEACAQMPELRPDGEPWPRITIVTPSFNQGEFIEETIRSVLLQGYPNLEYFIMDGGSTDQSVEIIKRYAAWIDHWESGPDGGQAAAINTGLARATGLWFHNINSDDVMSPSSLKAIGLASIKADVVAGPVKNVCGSDVSVTENNNLSLENLLRIYRPGPECSWHQPGVILKRDNLLSLGGFPTEFRNVFDYAGICRYLENFTKVQYISDILVIFRIHDASKTSTWGPVHDQEEVAARRYLSNTLSDSQNRNLAKLEANRRELRNGLSAHWSDRLTGKLFLKLSAPILRDPRIIFDRMWLYYLRRKIGMVAE